MTESGKNEILANSLKWTVHPVKRRPLISIAVTFFIFLIGYIVNYSTQSQWFTILALVVLFGSLSKFYFPTIYELNNKMIIIKTTTQTLKKEWQLYRSYYPDKNGVLLSPYSEQTRMENFRGIYLMFEKNKDDVLKYIEFHINKEKLTITENSTGETK
ncbi:MAG: hypothetical protein DRP35_05035 [Candidatus Zixiibacteriota bacterium]|nr:MAG: hypothetical protein DRP35_05035 [candidate division Zixibacteria bacterium]